jgi:hydroxymethylpyrimidine pyrophosphatase-like HAD family hydrolase
MLQNADFPVAVENAPDDVKALAKYITTSNNNGAIADLIRYLEEING